MRSRTYHLLQATFSIALAACRDKTATTPPPTPTSTALATTETSTPTALPVPTAMATTTLHPALTERRNGQQCLGSIVAGLHPGKPVDYLELRLDYYPMQANTHEIVVAGQTGTPCSTAKDAATCTTALANAKAPDRGEYFVYTRGDEVGTVAGFDVGKFLAPIDGPEEAAATVANFKGESGLNTLCDPSKVTKTRSGFEVLHTTFLMCDEKSVTPIGVNRDGSVSSGLAVHTPPTPGCVPLRGGGRRPEGLLLGARVDRSTVGGFFAECTEIEVASVHAFRRLASELRGLGAPSPLQRRARRSMRDEARHTRTMRGFAKRYGAAPRRVQVTRLEPRALTAMAIENMVEGCVFETWAALLATWQAEHARDPEIREAMRTIARDETRHAALAWDVATWLEARLSPVESACVRAARDEALGRLCDQLDEDLGTEVREVAGLPSAVDARRLYAGWTRAAAVMPARTPAARASSHARGRSATRSPQA